jgi:gamma-glutamyl hercynylcysteine S-oxide synthase
MLTVQRESVVVDSLLQRVSNARQKSDSLFEIVRPEALYDRPISERHRIIFYIGHLEAFDWNLLHENVFGLRSFQPEFDRLFAFGIDPVGGGLPIDQPTDWPSLERVREYVSRIRVSLDEKLAVAITDDRYQRDGFSLDTLLNVAIEHRLMHVETLAYMLHQLPFSRKFPQPASAPVLTSPLKISMASIPGGRIHLGLSRQSGEFGWDNEFEAHTAEVPAFEIDRCMVSNGQFLQFLEDQGYERRELWGDADWEWRSASSVSVPVFWHKTDGAWFWRTMFAEIPLPLDWPVYVSHAEASAFARWAGKTLPTEEQWQRAAYGSSEEAERFYPWGKDAPTSTHGNFDFQSWDPMPVNAHPRGQSAFGIEGMLGNGWEWTSTAFGPFPGFEPFPFYRGYSADFFDGRHFVIKGGSSRTAACMLRPTFRNWFQSHYQYVYAGFRCVNK